MKVIKRLKIEKINNMSKIRILKNRGLYLNKKKMIKDTFLILKKI